MSSRIEQQIDQIEDYIEGCKYQPFSNTKIIVDREELEDLLEQRRAKTPEEIRHYQRIISNKEAILSDARKKAEELISEATQHTNELVNEHEIMQQAYTQANEVVQLASQQAQEILDQAVSEANAYRASAARYMDDMLAQLEEITARTSSRAARETSEYMNNLGAFLDTIRQNRNELAMENGGGGYAQQNAAYGAPQGQLATGDLSSAIGTQGSIQPMGTGTIPQMGTGQIPQVGTGPIPMGTGPIPMGTGPLPEAGPSADMMP